MRIILKILLFPINVVLTILTFFLSLLLGVGKFFLNFISVLIFIVGVICFIHGQPGQGVLALILAFLFSSHGLIRIADLAVFGLRKIKAGIRKI